MATSGQTRSELGLTEANRGALAQVRAAAQRERPRHVARIAGVLAGARVEADAEVLLSAASGRGSTSLGKTREARAQPLLCPRCCRARDTPRGIGGSRLSGPVAGAACLTARR